VDIILLGYGEMGRNMVKEKMFILMDQFMKVFGKREKL